MLSRVGATFGLNSCPTVCCITGDDSDEEDTAELDNDTDAQEEEEDEEDTAATLQRERQASHGQAGTQDADAAMTDATNHAGEEEEEVGGTGRLFLRNLPFSTAEAELSEAFSEFGDLQEVHLVLDRSVFVHSHWHTDLMAASDRQVSVCSQWHMQVLAPP